MRPNVMEETSLSPFNPELEICSMSTRTGTEMTVELVSNLDSSSYDITSENSSTSIEDFQTIPKPEELPKDEFKMKLLNNETSRLIKPHQRTNVLDTSENLEVLLNCTSNFNNLATKCQTNSLSVESTCSEIDNLSTASDQSDDTFNTTIEHSTDAVSTVSNNALMTPIRQTNETFSSFIEPRDDALSNRIERSKDALSSIEQINDLLNTIEQSNYALSSFDEPSNDALNTVIDHCNNAQSATIKQNNEALNTTIKQNYENPSTVHYSYDALSNIEHSNDALNTAVGSSNDALSNTEHSNDAQSTCIEPSNDALSSVVGPSIDAYSTNEHIKELLSTSFEPSNDTSSTAIEPSNDALSSLEYTKEDLSPFIEHSEDATVPIGAPCNASENSQDSVIILDTIQNANTNEGDAITHKGITSNITDIQSKESECEINKKANTNSKDPLLRTAEDSLPKEHQVSTDVKKKVPIIVISNIASCSSDKINMLNGQISSVILPVCPKETNSSQSLAAVNVDLNWNEKVVDETSQDEKTTTFEQSHSDIEVIEISDDECIESNDYISSNYAAGRNKFSNVSGKRCTSHSTLDQYEIDRIKRVKVVLDDLDLVRIKQARVVVDPLETVIKRSKTYLKVDTESSEESESEDEDQIREGEEFQAVVEDFAPCPQSGVYASENDSQDDIAMWMPIPHLDTERVSAFIQKAKHNYGYREDQALGLLYYHKYNFDVAYYELSKYYNLLKQEWSIIDKEKFEKLIVKHKKNFEQIQVNLSHKTVRELVCYYYERKILIKKKINDSKEPTKPTRFLRHRRKHAHRR